MMQQMLPLILQMQAITITTITIQLRMVRIPFKLIVFLQSNSHINNSLSNTIQYYNIVGTPNTSSGVSKAPPTLLPSASDGYLLLQVFNL